jgi:hypothetical protein
MKSACILPKFGVIRCVMYPYLQNVGPKIQAKRLLRKTYCLPKQILTKSNPVVAVCTTKWKHGFYGLVRIGAVQRKTEARMPPPFEEIWMPLF